MHGRCDFLARNDGGDAGVIVDLKMGLKPIRNDAVTLQIIAYSAMVLQMTTLKSVQAFAFSPWTGQEISTELTMEELGEWIAKVELVERQVIKAFLDPLGPIGHTAASHEACEFCPARGICTTWQKKYGAHPIEKMRSSLDLLADPGKLSEALQMGSRAAKANTYIRELARKFVADGGEIPGYEVQTSQRRTITDTRGLLGVLSAYGATDEQLKSVMSLPLGATRKLFEGLAVDQGVKKKDAKKRFDHIIEEYSDTETVRTLKETADGP